MAKLLVSIIVLLLFACIPAAAIAGDNPVEKKQYLYRLQLIPRLVDETNWTDKDNKIVGEHFERLKGLLDDGTLILAGRTLNTDKTAFGIVILEAGSEEEARALMDGDPTVREGIMTAELFPYRVALIRTETPE